MTARGARIGGTARICPTLQDLSHAAGLVPPCWTKLIFAIGLFLSISVLCYPLKRKFPR